MTGNTAFFRLLSHLAGIGLILLATEAFAFDYDRYKPADLDAIASRKPSGPGADVFRGEPYRLDVTVVSQAAPCATGFLKRSMIMMGIGHKDAPGGIPISNCVKVRTAKGKELLLYIQDVLTEPLAKEVPAGKQVTLYAVLMFLSQDGPGILINEFSAKEERKAENDCGCGRDFHSGPDYSAQPGSPVPALDDGVVVRIEQDEQAVVETPTAGRCGRYVVVKHSFPNGRAVYSRYAQLGRLASKDGTPITVGQQIRKHDAVGEVGSQALLHFEIRPADDTTMDRSAEWTQPLWC
jgi:Peptidase family M23